MVPSLDHEEILFFEGQLASIVNDRGPEAGVSALFAMLVAASGFAASAMGVDGAKAELSELIPALVDLGRARDIEAARLAAMLDDFDPSDVRHPGH